MDRSSKVSSRPKVWVVKEQVRSTGNGPVPVDYTAAYQYGDVEFITEFDLPPRNGSLSDEWYKQVLRFVDAYDAKRDHIVLTGSPLAIFLVGFIMGSLRVEPRLLIWRREHNIYIPMAPRIDLAGVVNAQA